MIPKIIHYCWFGRGKKTPLIEYCIESWRKVLPDYQIIEWNEDNFDIESHPYAKEAHEARKWAFVADYARLNAVYQYGGIYFDTDIEVLKKFDNLLSDEAFIGMEVKDSLAMGVIGAEPKNATVKWMLDQYEGRHFLQEDGSLDTRTNSSMYTKFFREAGAKLDGKEVVVRGFRIYPPKYFYPYNFSMLWNKPAKISYTIHYAEGNWDGVQRCANTFSDRLHTYVVGKLRDTIGTDRVEKIRKRLKR